MTTAAARNNVVRNSTADTELSPWMAKLSPESQAAVRRNVSKAPPLSDRKRERLRLLFRPTVSER